MHFPALSGLFALGSLILQAAAFNPGAAIQARNINALGHLPSHIDIRDNHDIAARHPSPMPPHHIQERSPEPEWNPSAIEPSSFNHLAARNVDSKGNGIYFPVTAIPVFPGSINVRFVTGVPWNWTTIYIDLYNKAGKQYFVRQLAAVDAFNVLDSSKKFGTVPVFISDDLPVGPNYILKIWGYDQYSGEKISIPDSEIFAVQKRDLGEFRTPINTTVWYSGRNTVAQFKLGSQLMTATTVRLEITSTDLGFSYVVADNIRVTNTSNTVWTNVTFNIPSCFKLAQTYYLLVAANNGPFSSVNNRRTPGELRRGLYLASQPFTLFENSILSIYPLSINILTPTPMQVNSTAQFNWQWIRDRQVINTWYVDLYTAGEESRFFTGRRIAEVYSPNMALTWLIPSDLNTGVYFIRVYGYKAGDERNPDADPYSSISTVFTIQNRVTDPGIVMKHLTPPSSWWNSAHVNVSWIVESNPQNITIQGFHVDLFKNTAPYKRIATLTPEPVGAERTWTIIKAPAVMINSVDYQVRARAVLPERFPMIDSGAISSMFSVVAKPAGTTFGTPEKPINWVPPPPPPPSATGTRSSTIRPTNGAGTGGAGNTNIGWNAGRKTKTVTGWVSVVAPVVVAVVLAIFNSKFTIGALALTTIFASLSLLLLAPSSSQDTPSHTKAAPHMDPIDHLELQHKGPPQCPKWESYDYDFQASKQFDNCKDLNVEVPSLGFGDRFSVQLCMSRRTCGEGYFLIKRKDVDSCRKAFEQEISWDSEVDERFKRDVGPDAFWLKFDGPERYTVTDWRHLGDCTYKLPFKLHTTGIFKILLVHIYDNFDGVNEGHVYKWYYPKYDVILDAQQMDVCADVGCERFTYKKLHSDDTLPACGRDDTLKGVFLRMPEDQPELMSEKEEWMLKSYKHPYIWHPLGCRFPHTYFRHADNACYASNKTSYIIGDSQSRGMFDTAHLRLDGKDVPLDDINKNHDRNDGVFPSSPSDPNSPAFKLKYLWEEYLTLFQRYGLTTETFDGMKYGPDHLFTGVSTAFINTGQWPAAGLPHGAFWSMGKYKAHVTYILHTIRQINKQQIATGIPPTRFVWIGVFSTGLLTPEWGNPGMYAWHERIFDQRGYYRLKMWSDEIRKVVEGFGVQFIDGNRLTSNWIRESPDGPHFHSTPAMEGVVDMILHSAALCDDIPLQLAAPESIEP
ncbi:hypothetical protein HDV05_004610 [Chytridiales sp. JEL 0842]|nr:hypothetical protein HDV05_004610 [Chytridiales sp. JEL 0842]